MIDTSFKYAQWSTNVNTMGMNWQTYHEGIWFNPAEKTYDDAVEEIKETIRQKVLKDHPHLIAFDKQNDAETLKTETENRYPLGIRPNMTTHGTVPPLVLASQTKAQEEKEEPYDIIKEINSCTSQTVLKIYEKRCKTLEQQDAYKKKAKELNKQSV